MRRVVEALLIRGKGRADGTPIGALSEADHIVDMLALPHSPPGRSAGRITRRTGGCSSGARGGLLPRISGPDGLAGGAAGWRTNRQWSGGGDRPANIVPVQTSGAVLESRRRRGPALPGNVLAQQPLAPALPPHLICPGRKLRCARVRPACRARASPACRPR